MTAVLIMGVLMIAGLLITITTADVALEPIPAPLKVPVQGGSYQDDAFFKIADPILKTLSNKTVPVESQRMKAYGAYSSLKDMSVSPQVYNDANNALHYLYYAAKTGEAYEEFFDAKKSVASMTTGSEYYELASIYAMTATNWWALIASRYPNLSTFILPEDSAPYPESSSTSGTTLEGMKYPIPIAQKESDPSKPFKDQEIMTTVQRWVEDNLETIPNTSELKGKSQGTYFITSDGPKWAKSTYIGLTSKNVNPDFYDTANYINAFLNDIAQARESYDDYVSEKTSIMLISDGRKQFDAAQSYYEDAGFALSKFIDKIPNVNTSTKLPAFPDFEELPRGRQTQQDELMAGSEDNGNSPWSGTSWTGGKSGLY